MGAAGPSASESVGNAGDSAGDSAGGPVSAATAVLGVAGSEECRRQAKDVCFMPVVSRLSLPPTLSKVPRVRPSVSGLDADRWTREKAAASSPADCDADAASGPRAEALGEISRNTKLMLEAVHSASTTPSAPSSVVSTKFQSPDIREFRALQADPLKAAIAHGSLRVASSDDGSVQELASDSELLRLDTVDLASPLCRASLGSGRASMDSVDAAAAAAASQAVGEVAMMLDKLDDAVYGAILAVREEVDCECNGESLPSTVPSTAEPDVSELMESLPLASCSDSSSDRHYADPTVADLQDMLLQASLGDAASERRPSCLASSSSDERTERRRSVRFQTTPECVELQAQDDTQETAESDLGSSEVSCSIEVSDDPYADPGDRVAFLECSSFADLVHSAKVIPPPISVPNSDDVLREFLNSPISDDAPPPLPSVDVLRSPPPHWRDGLSPEPSTAVSLLRRSATAVAKSMRGTEAEKAQFEVQFLVLQELLVEMEQARWSPNAANRQRTVGLALAQALHQLKPRHPEQVKLCEEFKEALSAFHVESSSPLQSASRPLLPAPPPAPLPTPPAERRSLQATFVAEPGLSKASARVTPLELPRRGNSDVESCSLASRLSGSRDPTKADFGQVDVARDDCSADGEFSLECSEVASSCPSTPAFAAGEDLSKASVQEAREPASANVWPRASAGADADAGAGAGIHAGAAGRSSTSMETLARAAFGKLWERGGAERCSLAGFNECSLAADGAASFRPLHCDEQTPSKTSEFKWPRSSFGLERACEDFTEGRPSSTSPSNGALASPTFGDMASPTFGGLVDETDGQWPQNNDKSAAPGGTWPTAPVPSLISPATSPAASATRAAPLLASGIDGIGGGTFSGHLAVTLESPTADVFQKARLPGQRPLGSSASTGRPAAVADAIAGAVSSGSQCCRSPMERPLAAWDVDDVQSWAASLAPQLSLEISKILAEHAINGQVLVTLTESELSMIGITKFGWRRQLVLAIQELVRQQQEHDKCSDSCTSQDEGEVASIASRPRILASDSPRRPVSAASPPAPAPQPRLSAAVSPTGASSQQLTGSVVLHVPASLQARDNADSRSNVSSGGPASGASASSGPTKANGTSMLRRLEAPVIRRVSTPSTMSGIRGAPQAKNAASTVMQGLGSGLEATAPHGRDATARRELSPAQALTRLSAPVQTGVKAGLAREPSPCSVARDASPCRAPTQAQRRVSEQQKPPSRSSPSALPTFFCQLPRTEPLLQSAKRSPTRLEGRSRSGLGNSPQRC